MMERQGRPRGGGGDRLTVPGLDKGGRCLVLDLGPN